MDTTRFKDKLLAERARLIEKSAFYKDEDPLKDGQVESSYSFDDDTAESEGHDRIVATTESVDEYLKDIDNALTKIAEDTYGTCENCHDPIPEERLEVYPAARLCITCQKN